jgi:tRNA (guanine37-N1)-methyltransferase
MNKLHCDVITIFPEYFLPLDLSLVGKARENGLVDIRIHDLRDQASGVHRSVDDTPYGGGAGMVMTPEPWAKAIEQVSIERDFPSHTLIMLTPAGERFTQKIAEELVHMDHLIFACGRYEGIDQRVTDYFHGVSGFSVREISVGDYVLNGGEVASLVMLEAIIRLIPGVLGNPDSLTEESHSLPDGSVEYPSYTKPANWRGLDVPDVLLSGNHALIHAWRMDAANRRTLGIARQTGE